MTAILLALCLTACGQNMVKQEKMLPDRATRLFPDGKVNQHPPAGTVARDSDQWRRELTERPPLTAALLKRGQQRFLIDCAPCHGPAGDGDGMIPRHGFPRPPNYTLARLRDAPPSRFVDVITKGYGVMFSYADRVKPADRWAIAAYIKALQLSQAAPAGQLPPEMRARLDQSPSDRSPPDHSKGQAP